MTGPFLAGSPALVFAVAREVLQLPDDQAVRQLLDRERSRLEAAIEMTRPRAHTTHERHTP